MAGVVDGGRASVTNLSTSIQTHKAGCSSSLPLEAFFFSESSVSFVGSRSMVSFEDVHEVSGLTTPLFCAFDRERNGGDDLDEYFRHPEKKRKLSVDQVQFLEKSFEAENKLEPERKIQLAKDLGLQPRQVAIWFQNRRARLKTKQVDKDYETLKASYDTLKSDYDNLVKEKNKLKAEVESLSKELLLGQTENGTSSEKDTLSQESQEKQVGYSASEGEVSKLSILACKQEDLSAAKSEMFDSESQHYTDGVQSSLLEAVDSSYAFEPDHSQLSQDEDDNVSKSILPPYVFPKLEDVDCSNTPASFEDHAFWSWSY